MDGLREDSLVSEAPVVQVAPPLPPLQPEAEPEAEPAAEPDAEVVQAQPEAVPQAQPEAVPQPEPEPEPEPRRAKRATTSSPRAEKTASQPERKPEPVGQAVESEPQAVDMGEWFWGGDAVSARLVGGGQTYGPGRVPAGRYQILAVFEEGAEAIPAGTATIEAGGNTSIRCNAIFQKCQ